jgi:hypothetical protein
MPLREFAMGLPKLASIRGDVPASAMRRRGFYALPVADLRQKDDGNMTPAPRRSTR